MNTSKKSLIIGLIVVVLAVVAIFIQRSMAGNGDFTNNGTPLTNDPATKKYFIWGFKSQADCEARGGKFVMHGVGNTCEKIAPDAGRACIFDEDCEKNCIYAGESAAAGMCEAYSSEQDGRTTCHRPKNETSPQQGKIICDMIIS